MEMCVQLHTPAALSQMGKGLGGLSINQVALGKRNSPNRIPSVLFWEVPLIDLPVIWFINVPFHNPVHGNNDICRNRTLCSATFAPSVGISFLDLVTVLAHL